MKIGAVLQQIDAGAMALPVFQRGYVWNRDQVRGLMDSLYRRHPVGSLLTWVTRTESVETRGQQPPHPGYVTLLLDGQQRITSLYGIVRGHAPPFFEGKVETFTGLYFNMRTEAFEFYAPLRMDQDPCWVSVTDVMKQGIGPFMTRIFHDEELRNGFEIYNERLTRISTIQDVDLLVEDVTGEDKTVDIVVEIFNRVNSGGTKLSKGDLALAKICASWPDARREMIARLDRWRAAGFNFKLEWLLRCVNSLVTGEALFPALANVSAEEFRDGLNLAEKRIDYVLNAISSRLGLDHDRVLGSVYSFALLVRYIEDRGGQLADPAERDKILYWYIHTLLWGRYSGSTESVLNQDLAAIEEPSAGLQELMNGLRRNRGDLKITSNDFATWSRGSRFYPLLYMLTRVNHSRDWDTGFELSNLMLGSLSSLQLHHIFPKSRLYKFGFDRAEVNALANFTFLTQETNLKVSNRNPEEYIPEYANKHPGVMESHWIPMDPELWKIENYREFLEARRGLLAAAANRFLDELWQGQIPETKSVSALMDRADTRLGAIHSGDEEKVLLETNIWVIDQGLPEGEMLYELVDTDSGEQLAVLDLAWPNGLQEGFSQPVALLIDEDPEIESVASQAGFRFYTDVRSFKRYVLEQILSALSIAS